MTNTRHNPHHRKPLGSFSASLDHTTHPENHLPALQGHLRMPNTKTKDPLGLWPAYSRTTGELLFLGRTAGSPQHQIHSMIVPPILRDPDRLLAILQKESIPGVALQPREIIVIPNPTCIPEQPHVPQYYGFYNPGDAQPIHRIPITPRLNKHGYLELAGHMEPYHPERAAPWQLPHISECNRSSPRPPRRNTLLHALRTSGR